MPSSFSIEGLSFFITEAKKPNRIGSKLPYKRWQVKGNFLTRNSIIIFSDRSDIFNCLIRYEKVPSDSSLKLLIKKMDSFNFRSLSWNSCYLLLDGNSERKELYLLLWTVWVFLSFHIEHCWQNKLSQFLDLICNIFRCWIFIEGYSCRNQKKVCYCYSNTEVRSSKIGWFMNTDPMWRPFWLRIFSVVTAWALTGERESRLIRNPGCFRNSNEPEKNTHTRLIVL